MNIERLSIMERNRIRRNVRTKQTIHERELSILTGIINDRFGKEI